MNVSSAVPTSLGNEELKHIRTCRKMLGRRPRFMSTSLVLFSDEGTEDFVQLMGSGDSPPERWKNQ